MDVLALSTQRFNWLVWQASLVNGLAHQKYSDFIIWVISVGLTLACPNEYEYS